MLNLLSLFADDLLQGQPAPVELGLDRREPRQGGLAEAVALDLPRDGRRCLLYGAYGALQKQEISLFHEPDTIVTPASR